MKVKLHLGCGTIYKKGYVNIDIDRNVKADLYHDLTKKFPYKDNSVDEILCINVLEHIPNPVSLLKECHRVLKQRGKLKFRVPLANTLTAYCDLTHINHFTPQSFKERIYYGYRFRKKKIYITLPLLHSAKWKILAIRFPSWLVYVNKFIEVFTGIEGELYK